MKRTPNTVAPITSCNFDVSRTNGDTRAYDASAYQCHKSDELEDVARLARLDRCQAIRELLSGLLHRGHEPAQLVVVVEDRVGRRTQTLPVAVLGAEQALGAEVPHRLIALIDGKRGRVDVIGEGAELAQTDLTHKVQVGENDRATQAGPPLEASAG